MGPCLSPGAPLVRACPLGHQPGTLFCLERTIPKGPILASNWPSLITRDFWLLGSIRFQEDHFAKKTSNFYFLWYFFSFRPF